MLEMLELDEIDFVVAHSVEYPTIVVTVVIVHLGVGNFPLAPYHLTTLN